MPMIDNDTFMITTNDTFMIDDKSPTLPVDKNGIPIRIGDLLFLKHNLKSIHMKFIGVYLRMIGR